MSLPTILLDPFPGNLTRMAAADYLRALGYSVENWGLAVTLKTRNRLLARCIDIGKGRAIGHKRPDIRADRSFLCVNEKPFVLIYDPGNHLVVRILHQARDLPRLLR